MPPLLRPSAPTAADAILCGDPARALTIAQHLIELPRMSNHNRGLWGYHGVRADGSELTVQGTGIGGPSAAAVLEELAGLGARRVIRVGTCAAAPAEHPLGSALVVTAARGADGTSRAFGAGAEIEPDAVLTERLLSQGADGCVVVSSDRRRQSPPPGCVADMQTAAVLACAHDLGLAAAAILVITRAGEAPLPDEPTEAAVLSASERAARAFRG